MTVCSGVMPGIRSHNYGSYRHSIAANMSAGWLPYNLVPTEKRDPGLGLVTCLLSKKNPQGRVVCLLDFCLIFFVILKSRLLLKFLQVAMFDSSLQVVISWSRYCNLNLKPKQVQCLEAIYLGRNGIWTTGYDKSLIFHRLPLLFLEKNYTQGPVPSASFRPVVVVLPLNALIKDQIRRSSKGSANGTFLNAKKKSDLSDLELDASDANYTLLKDAK